MLTGLSPCGLRSNLSTSGTQFVQVSRYPWDRRESVFSGPEVLSGLNGLSPYRPPGTFETASFPNDLYWRSIYYIGSSDSFALISNDAYDELLQSCKGVDRCLFYQQYEFARVSFVTYWSITYVSKRFDR